MGTHHSRGEFLGVVGAASLTAATADPRAELTAVLG